METTTHEQQTQIYDLRYCAVALAEVTDSATEVYKNYTDRNIASFTHKRTKIINEK